MHTHKEVIGIPKEVWEDFLQFCCIKATAIYLAFVPLLSGYIMQNFGKVSLLTYTAVTYALVTHTTIEIGCALFRVLDQDAKILRKVSPYFNYLANKQLK